MLHTVKKAEYLEGYKIRLHFNDRKIKVVDLENTRLQGVDFSSPLKSKT
jgi:hypothetical protein